MAIPLKFCLLFTIGFFLINTPLSGQWTLYGQVFDATSGEGLAYVNIRLDHTKLGTTSDQKGNFKIEGLTDDQYGIIFSMIGFQTIRMDQISSESDPILAEMQPEIYQKDEVVVSASRKTQSLSLAPASVGLVTQSQLNESGIRSFDDAFHNINGIQVTRSSGSNVQALSIRGASEVAGGGIGNRVLLLLDGRPAITPESGGALWNLVPLGAIDRVEVIKGAYSSLFGSSAMGGIVNVITKTPDTIAHTDVKLYYGFYNRAPAYADYDKFNDFHGVDLTHSSKLHKVSYVFNLAAKSNDGHREKTAFETYNGFGKILYAFSPNRNMQLSAMYSDINNDTPATWLSTTHSYTVAAYRKDDTQHRREWNADLQYTAFAQARIKYTTRFYYYSALSDFVFNGDPANDSTNVNLGKQYIDKEKVNVDRLGHATQIDVSLGDHHYLLGGIEIQSDFVDGKPDTVLYGRHKAWNIGAFIQDQIMLDDRWIITGGIRYDQYKIAHTFSEGNVNPKIAAVYELTKRISFRGLLARAFRTPSIAERFTKFEQGGGLSFKPNPLLRAEKLTLSAEVGTKINIRDKLKLDVALFYNHYKDLISYQIRSVPGQPLLFEVVNLNKAVMQGFEISLDYAPFHGLHVLSGYTFLDARDASANRYNDVLPYKSKHTTYITLLTGYKNFRLSLQARSRSKIEEVFIYPGSEPAGYVILSGKALYKLTPHLSVYFTVGNLNNVQYEEIERYRLENRNFTFGLNFSL
jgi:outer membrane receptor for ferrienterochelin and colicin